MSKAADVTVMRVGARNLPYSQLANEFLRDNRLAWEARAVLSFILSHPADWEFTFDWLRRQEPVIGRDRLKRHIEQLVDLGYCKRDRERLGNGTLGPYEYVFTDVPNQSLKTSNWLPATGGQSHIDKESPKQGHKDRRAGARSAQRGKADGDKRRPAMHARYVSEAALDRVRKTAPGWDRQFLLRKFMDWPESAKAQDLDAAFLGWVKKFTKGKPPE
jgi:hypothetical protein